ncbi:C40 family peptidase [Arthrobacter jiangjiafuii]|uniref:C40 family peptidase n=2 Tax=Arthrobacter jiangjiafuii TaxID=2817475 RepID=A0A975M8F1_9MICC|nr:NlpC/P60 family protein [Arthrobacter jiangjiafuii]MBP3045074.1 C40 family peptidase [Arthrobacter jiangjiafuii]QWC11604.1 C40 family peptidase [Arthrobacter jiangjiafuii]
MGRQAAVVVAASGLVLAAGLPAQAAVSTDRQALDATPLSAVTAAGTVTVSAQAPFELATLEAVSSVSGAEQRAQIAAEEAAAVEAEAAAVVAAQAEQAAAVTVAQSAPAAATAAPAASTTAAVAAPAADVSASGYGAALVAAAYGQLGVAQDCTAMVEKALRSIGKSVGDLAPGQFFAYGSVVGSPQPGDLVITGGHVAIYVGNGQVISGGLNGMNTGLHSLSDLPGASFVRVN